MHLHRVTYIIQKPQVAVLHHKTLTFYQENALAHFTNAVSCCFTKAFAVFLSPFGGQIVARTSSAEAVRMGSLSATARQRSRLRSDMQ
jgi:hypothetical protein